MKATFESSKTYGLFTAHFDEELYHYAASYYDTHVFGRDRPMYGIVGVAKVLEDVEISQRNYPPYQDMKRFLEQDFATIHGDSNAVLYKFKDYISARLDIKLMKTTGDFQILDISDHKANLWKPGWLQKGGIGYQIQSYAGKLEIIAKSTVDGPVNLNLMGLDIRDPKEYSKRIPYWIDYTKLTVNGKVVLDKLTPAWHDKRYYYTINAKAGEEIKVQMEWLPHRADVIDKVAEPPPKPPATDKVDAPTPKPVIKRVAEPSPKPPATDKVDAPTPKPVIKRVAEPSPKPPATDKVDAPTPKPVVKRVAEPSPKPPATDKVVAPAPKPVIKKVAEPSPKPPTTNKVVAPTPKPVVKRVAEPSPKPPATDKVYAQIIDNFKRYITARVQIKLMSVEGDFQILSVSDSRAIIKKPTWYQKGGIGYQINSYFGKLEITAKGTIDGRVNLRLMGIDVRDPEDKSKRIPYWIDYTKLTVNGKEILDKRTPTWHDKPYRHDMDVKAGEEIKVQVEWLPHRSDD